MQGNLAFPILTHFFGKLRRHIGDDETRSDSVGTDAALAEFFGHRLGETDDARFRGRVVGLTGVAAHTHHRTEADDAASALAAHDRRHRLGEVEHRLEVYIDHRVPLFFGHAEQKPVFGDAGVVDQHVDASEILCYGSHHFRGVFGVGGVRGVAFGLYAHAFQFLHQRLHVLVVTQVGESDVGTFGGEAQRNGLSDAARRAGNQSDFVLK